MERIVCKNNFNSKTYGSYQTNEMQYTDPSYLNNKGVLIQNYQNNSLSVDLKFIIITEELSFIPDNILNCCEIINISRPTKTAYIKCVKTKLPAKLKPENITIYNVNISKWYSLFPLKYYNKFSGKCCLAPNQNGGL